MFFMVFENSFENNISGLKKTRSSSTDDSVEKLRQSKSREKIELEKTENTVQESFNLEDELKGESQKYRSSRSIEENVEKLKKTRHTEKSGENSLNEKPDSESIGNTKMARRVLESEWMLENRRKAVQKEELYSESGINGSLAKLAVYEEDGELKKDNELIQNALYSDKLEEEAEELLEKGVSGRKSLESWIEDAQSAVKNYEETALESIYLEEENMVKDEELINQRFRTVAPDYVEDPAVAD